MAKRTRRTQPTTTEAPATEPTPDQPTTPEADQPTEGAATDQEVQQLQDRRAAILAELAALDDRLAVLLPHMLMTSQVQKPVALCREVFVAMVGQRRRDVVAALVNKGVAANTAKTQYQILKGKLERGELAEDLAALAAEA